MKKSFGYRLRAAACVATLFVALPAAASIASFNTAVKAGDYKQAAVEAASTWPTLDKSRADIALIAREFGFAAFMAGDFAAAKSYAEFAATTEVGGNAPSEARATSTVLLRLTEHRARPTADTRKNLSAALTARAAYPVLDNITYLGFDAIVTYDVEKAVWKDAIASSDLAIKLTSSAGPAYLIPTRRLMLVNSVASYMATKNKNNYEKIDALRKTIVADINAAPSDAAAMPMVPLYWETVAWDQSIASHIKGRGRPLDLDDEKDPPRPSERQMRLLSSSDTEGPCVKRIEKIREPKYPSSALFQGMIGTIVVQVDIDESGAASNPKILAAVPEKHFGEAVLASLKDIQYQPDKDNWGPTCSLARQGQVITFAFSIG